MLNENDVETVVLLGDKRVDGHINIDLDVEKLESKGDRATYAEIKPDIRRIRQISWLNLVKSKRQP